MEKKKKKYIKPETVVIKVEPTKDLMIASGTEPCDCYQHRMYGGCERCPGGGKVGHTCTCGCNHWDDETHEIIPG